MSIKGIIAAAGCSSRMGQFKPLLDVNGYPLIVWTVMNMKNAGIRDICVVVGRNAEEMESVLEPLQVKTVRNEGYQTTDMLYSVKLGLKAIPDGPTDGILLLPGDNAMVSPKTIGKIISSFLKNKPSVLYPVYDGKRTHPPLIGKECFETIYSYQGSDGLRGALLSFEETAKEILIPDKGTGLDADYPEDYEIMVSYAREYFGISPNLCRRMMEEEAIPEPIRKHSEAVAVLALTMGEKLVQMGYPLDLTLIESGALLHDLLRTGSHHAKAGKLLLQEKGYLAIANLIGNHMTLVEVDNPQLNEETLVFLADKLVWEDQRITLAQRYEKAFFSYPPDTEIGKRIEMDFRKAEKLLREYEVMTHEILSE